MEIKHNKLLLSGAAFVNSQCLRISTSSTKAWDAFPWVHGDLEAVLHISALSSIGCLQDSSALSLIKGKAKAI